MTDHHAWQSAHELQLRVGFPAPLQSNEEMTANLVADLPVCPIVPAIDMLRRH